MNLTRGRGTYHTEKADSTFLVIMEVLSGRKDGVKYKPKLEGKEYRYKDIKEKTGLNDPTLAKYLKPLIKLKLVSKRVDLESGKYPYPVYYRAEPEFLTWIDAQISTKELSEKIEGVLLETKNPLFVLKLIDLSCQGHLEFMFSKLKEERNVPEHKLRFLLDLFVWEPYRVLTWKLVEATKKHIDEIPLKVYSDTELLESLEQLKKKLDYGE